MLATPFHPRTGARCDTMEWRNWSGWAGAACYQPSVEREYWAIRNAAALLDVSPLFKYEVEGRDAARLLDRVMTRAVSGAAVGRVLYSPWCDEDGKVIDDGTVTRIAADRFRVTAAEPSRRWFEDCGFGMDVTVREVSTELAALALQGPLSRDVLAAAGVTSIAGLRYFHSMDATIAGVALGITRTGYTGDLGYELWIPKDSALPVFDALERAGASYGLTLSGLAALDIARVEASLLLLDVDYVSSRRALTEAQKSSPLELGLGRLVDLDRGDFVGRSALVGECRRGPKLALVGLDVDWPALESLFLAADLPPQVTGRVTRAKIPVFREGRQIGQATSLVFSPILKRYVALASVASEWSKVGESLAIEITVEDRRRRAPARIVPTPFFNPERKRR